MCCPPPNCGCLTPAQYSEAEAEKLRWHYFRLLSESGPEPSDDDEVKTAKEDFVRRAAALGLRDPPVGTLIPLVGGGVGSTQPTPIPPAQLIYVCAIPLEGLDENPDAEKEGEGGGGKMVVEGTPVSGQTPTPSSTISIPLGVAPPLQEMLGDAPNDMDADRIKKTYTAWCCCIPCPCCQVLRTAPSTWVLSNQALPVIMADGRHEILYFGYGSGGGGGGNMQRRSSLRHSNKFGMHHHHFGMHHHHHHGVGHHHHHRRHGGGRRHGGRRR